MDIGELAGSYVVACQVYVCSLYVGVLSYGPSEIQIPNLVEPNDQTIKQFELGPRTL